MELHEDPQRLVETVLEQHAAVLGELHGDLASRLSEVPGRVIDQGKPRSFTRSAVMLDTLLHTRIRRESKNSTLRAASNGVIGVRLSDGKGMGITVRRHPVDRATGELTEPIAYFGAASQQMTFDDELGESMVGGIVQPTGYRLYVLWWPGGLGLGGAVLAAGLLLNQPRRVAVLYAKAPLPTAVPEVTTGSLQVAVPGQIPGILAPAAGGNSRRRNKDFDDLTGTSQEEAPPQTS